jgi:hypothetical protein
VFRLALRQTEGLIGSVLYLLGLDLRAPDHSTLSRRAETLEVPRPKAGSAPVLHLLVARRSAPCSTRCMGRWRPLPATAAATATMSYAEVVARHPAATVIVPPRANAVPSAAAKTAPTQRDAHLRCMAERGRMGWQWTSGYSWRALVEADISRWKRVVGDGLRFQTDGRQATEVAIAADMLNRMLDLGRPEYVRTA